MSNNLCGSCNSLIDILRNADWYSHISHHESLETLSKSAEEACGICSVLMEYLKSSAFRELPDLWDTLFPIFCESDTSSASWQRSFEMTFTSFGIENFSVTFILEAIEESADNQGRYVAVPTTNAPESWELIEKWLKQCTENHDRCNASIPEPWAPTRLLDVGTSTNQYIKLVECDKGNLIKQPYATLSHCWGRTPLIKTTRENVNIHLQGINPSDMPKTFSDTIRITRALHLRYLWIDSLCILQDSVDDWSHEADMMSKVYRYAFVNIAATGASDSSQGCFWNRDPRIVWPTEFSVQWKNCQNNESRRYHVVPEPRIWAQNLLNQPLNNRGWVLQERILSPRVLHFGSKQLFWECREFVACETYHHGLPHCLRGDRFIDIKTLDLGDEPRDDSWPAKYVSKSITGSENLLGRLWDILQGLFKPSTHEVTLNSTLKTGSIYRDWDAVVELYSIGALTFPGDKLVALSGLAQVMSISERHDPNDGYLAGLWQSSLPSHLLWTTEISEVTWKGVPDTQVPERYKDYIAPSWSWASIEGKISLTWCLNNYDPRDYLAKLESAEVIWANSGTRFGRVQSGYLKLSGPLACALWEVDNGPGPTSVIPCTANIWGIFPRYFDRQRAISIPRDDSTHAEILFDTRDTDYPEELVLLPIIGVMKRSAHENETVVGLVLQQLEDGETYSRVGLFYTTRPRLTRILRNMPRHSVTII